MARNASRRKVERLLYELEDCLSLMERKHGLCDASVAESNLGMTTRGDNSIEYSEMGGLSLDNSQSLMDETNEPLLLALVEDFILGQRLEMMGSGESEDDDVSPSSSFESGTCFSHEDSAALRQVTGIESFFSDNSDERSLSDELEIPEIPKHHFGKTRLLDKSKWQALLLSLSHQRYNRTKSTNASSALISEVQAQISQKESCGESTPNILKSWDRIKAVNPLKRSVLLNSANESGLPISKSALTVKSLFSPSELTKVSTVTTEKDVLKVSNALNSNSQSTPTNVPPSETISVGEIKTPALTQNEPTGENNIGFDENKSPLVEIREHIADEDTNTNETSLPESKENNEHVIVVDEIINEKKLPESCNANNDPIFFSDFCENVEVPNSDGNLVEDEQNHVEVPYSDCYLVADEHNRVQKTFTPLKGKIRLSLSKRITGYCSPMCETYENTASAFNNKSRQQVKIDKLVQEPILCSRCRHKLSEQSICAAIASESMDNVDCKLEMNKPDIVPICNIAANCKNGTCISGKQLNEIEKKERSPVLNDLSPSGEELKTTCENFPHVIPDVICLMSLDANDELHDIKQDQSDADSFSNNIEATISFLEGKTETPNIHIEFKDWTGNEVEIVQESPRKKAKRLFWKNSLLSNKESTNASGASSRGHFSQHSAELFSSDHITNEKSKVEGVVKEVDVGHTMEVAICKKAHKSKLFGIITKRNRGKVAEKSDSVNTAMDTIHQEEGPQENINALPVIVDDLLDEKQGLCSNSIIDDTNVAPLLDPIIVKVPAAFENEEALLVEQAMKEIHTDAKYDTDGFKTRSFIRSPVTLYRFLDYNPCRNELVQENSYDVFTDPVGLSVAELFAPNSCFAKHNEVKSKKDGLDGERGNEKPNATESDTHEHPSSNSSLKKVFRRLSKKVAFRENLVDTSPTKKSSSKDVIVESTMKKQKAAVNSKIKQENFKRKKVVLSKSQPEANAVEDHMKRTQERKKSEDTLKRLLHETSKSKKIKAVVKEEDAGTDTRDTGETIGYGTPKMTKNTLRKTSNSSPAVKKASIKKIRSPKAKGEISSKSKAHAERISELLNELKRVKSTVKPQGDKSSKRIKESPTQQASDTTIATLGTRQSTTSTLSRLTVEERKVARRMVHDIQLLAKIEKQRRSKGHSKSSLKGSDMDRTLTLLMAIEASRRSRVPASTKVGKEVSILSEKIEANQNSQPREINPVNNMTSAFGGLSFFTDITSKKERK